MKLNASITNVKGVGDKTAQTFEKLNIFTVEDVLFHFPRNYFRYPEAVTVEEITSLQESNLAIRAVIKKSPTSRNGRNMNITTLLGELFHTIGNYAETGKKQPREIRSTAAHTWFPNKKVNEPYYFMLTPKESPHLGQAHRCSPCIRGRRICALQ